MCLSCGSSEGCGTVEVQLLDGTLERICINEAAYCEYCDLIMFERDRIVYKGLKIHPACVACVDAAEEI